MNEQTWIDRSGWPAGPWDGEPDRIEWRDGEFTCLMLRHPTSGHWCGYVGVLPGHPWYGKRQYDHDDETAELPDIDVHCGVTYAEPCAEDDRPLAARVCHVPEPGEPARWWIGWDYLHAWDYSPRSAMSALRPGGGCFRPMHDETYKGVDHVKRDVANAVRQARESA